MSTRSQVAKFAAGLTEAYLECRQYGHAWKAYTVDKDGPRYVVTTVCPRCESKRVQTLDRTGMIVGHAHVTYSPGYLAHGIGRITGQAKGVIRLEGVHRVIDAQITGPTDTSIKRKPRTRPAGKHT